jgi:hypothetical protein
MYVPLEFVRGSGKGLFVYLTLIKSMTSSTYIRYNIKIFTVRLHNFYISVETNNKLRLIIPFRFASVRPNNSENAFFCLFAK